MFLHTKTSAGQNVHLNTRNIAYIIGADTSCSIKSIYDAKPVAVDRAISEMEEELAEEHVFSTNLSDGRPVLINVRNISKLVVVDNGVSVYMVNIPKPLAVIGSTEDLLEELSEENKKYQKAPSKKRKPKKKATTPKKKTPKKDTEEQKDDVKEENKEEKTA